MSTDHEAGPPPLGPGTLLRIRALWMSPIILGGVVIALMALIYVGSLVNPGSHLHDLPVAVVDQDQGVNGPSGHVDLGDDVVSALRGSAQVTDRLSLRTRTLDETLAQMNSGANYAAVVIPANFTQSLLTLAGVISSANAADTGTAPGTVQLLTNPRLGSAGVGLATGVLNSALAAISPHLGQQLTAVSTAAARSNPFVAASLAKPLDVVTVQHRPLPANSALGLSAFYLSLLATMCGFLGATLLNTTVDSALGFAATEVGTKWRQRPPVPITRWHTLLTKWTMATLLVPVLTGIVLLVAVAGLGLDAPGVGYLWLLLSLGAIGIAIGTLSLFAALGSLGQLVALMLFVYLALASAGATIPIEAIPSAFQAVSHVDPLRRLLDGTRAIIYFNGSNKAGWPAACVVLGIELVFWLLLGAIVTRWYDRRGLHRMRPELIDYVNRSVRAYAVSREATGTDEPQP